MAANELLRQLQHTSSWVLSLIGAGGSGKTSKAWYILDHWFPDSDILLFRYPEEKRCIFPEHIRSRLVFFDSWRDIAAHPGIVLLDDMAIHFISRSSNDKRSKDFVSNLTIGRHNGHRYIVTAQNSILSDKGLYESLTQFSLRCRMSIVQTMTEREEFLDLQLQVNAVLDHMAVLHDIPDLRSLCYCPETGETFCFPDWEWMTEEISTPFRGCVVEDGSLLRVVE